MPLVVAFLIGVIARAVTALLGVAVALVSEGQRRFRRAYQAGYAMVPVGVEPGAEVVDVVMARDPVALAPWDPERVVARVALVRGARSSWRNRGWWWNARSAIVVEVLPTWVTLGPNGLLVDRILQAGQAIAPEHVPSIRPSVETRAIVLLQYGDPWRQTLAAKTAALTSARFAEVLAADLDRDGDGELTAAASTELDARVRAWSPAIDATWHAALAGAFVDELDAEEVQRLSSAWERAIGWVDSSVVERGPFVSRLLGSVPSALRWLDRHPTLGICVTIVVLMPWLFIAPIPAVILYMALLVLAVGAVLGRRLLHRRRFVRRRWAPRGDVEKLAPDPRALRRAMRPTATRRTAIGLWHLVSLLESAEVWVGIEGPEPERPERSLRWLRDSGQKPPLVIRVVDGERFAMAFTDEHRHTAARRTQGIEWTARTRLTDLFEYARALGATGVVLDAGSEASIAIRGDPLGG